MKDECDKLNCFHSALNVLFSMGYDYCFSFGKEKNVVRVQNIFIGLLGAVFKKEKATIVSNRTALTPTAATFYLNKPM